MPDVRGINSNVQIGFAVYDLLRGNKPPSGRDAKTLAEAYDQQRLNKTSVAQGAAWALWVFPLWATQMLIVTGVPLFGMLQVPSIFSALAIWLFGYHLARRIVVQSNEAVGGESLWRRLRAGALGKMSLQRLAFRLTLVGMVLSVAQFVVWMIKEQFEPSYYGMNLSWGPISFVLMPVTWVTVLAYLIAGLLVTVLAIRVAVGYVRGKRAVYRMLVAFGGQSGVMKAVLGISAESLEMSAISFDGTAIVVDLPVTARRGFDQIENRMIEYHVKEFMLHPDSTPDRVRIVPADAATKKKRAALAATDGLVVATLSDDESSDDEILGRGALPTHNEFGEEL